VASWLEGDPVPKLLVLVLVAALAGCSGAARSLEPGECLDDRGCEIAEFCQKPDGSCDAAGVCRSRPQMCTQEHDPVCGCDRITYSNVCQARAAGASVARKGACEGG